MRIIGIVAVGNNLEIGQAGFLPWHHPADLSFFKKTTSGHVVVMGFNTWLSIGKPLPDRVNVVISRTGLVDDDRIISVGGVDEVLERFSSRPENLFIIGGARTYSAFRSKIDEWLVTRIPEKVDGADVFMKSDFLDGFIKISEEKLNDILVVERYVRENKTPE